MIEFPLPLRERKKNHGFGRSVAKRSGDQALDFSGEG
jgi:hypothetical protein